MSFPKYKIDDRVITSFREKGTVTGYLPRLEGEFQYSVTLSSGTVRKTLECDLRFDNSDYEKKDTTPIPPKCPKCNGDWAVTRFGASEWYDCDTCKDTAENLLKKNGRTYTSNLWTKGNDDKDWF